MPTFLIVALSIVAYSVIARVIAKIVLHKHIKVGEEHCRCNMNGMCQICWDGSPGFIMTMGSAFWPIMFAFFLTNFVITSGIKIIDSPIVFILNMFSQDKTEDEDTAPRQTRAVRKANRRLEIAKIYEQEALALEAAHDSNARLLAKKEALNPLHIGH